MRKLLKKLVAVGVISTVMVTPVFAKEGDLYYSQELGGWLKEVNVNGQERLKNQVTGDLKEKVINENTYIYELQAKRTTRVVNVILSNGVAMVQAKELADSLGLNSVEEGNNIEIFCYETRKKDISLKPSSVLIDKGSNKYWAEMNEI